MPLPATPGPPDSLLARVRLGLSTGRKGAGPKAPVGRGNGPEGPVPLQPGCPQRPQDYGLLGLFLTCNVWEDVEFTGTECLLGLQVQAKVLKITELLTMMPRRSQSRGLALHLPPCVLRPDFDSWD